MKKYQVISLDVWGNNDDGFEVNNAFATSFFIDIEESDTDAQIIEKLIESGFASEAARDGLAFDDAYIGNETLYLNDKETSEPFCQLNLISENK